jgi:hypothetical protein
MFKSLKKLIKPAVVIGAGFVANKFLPGSGKFVSKATSSLMGMGGGGGGSGGDFQIQDTSVAAQNYGGRVGFERSDKAGGNSNIKTADGEELRNEWDYRLTKWFRNKDSMFT